MIRRVFLVAGLALVVARAAAAQPRYTMTELPQFYGFQIADRSGGGTIVGNTLLAPQHPFVAVSGGLPEVLVVGSYGFAHAVNRSGSSVGTIATSSTLRCYRWEASGIVPFRWLDPVQGLPCSAYDINDSGTVVGSVGGRAFAMDADRVVLLNVPGNSAARSINSIGMIAGDFSAKEPSHLFRWFAGTYVDYGSWNGVPAYAVGISSKGVIAANARSADGAIRYALVHDGTAYHQLYAWAAASEATQINGRGDVVGSYLTGTSPRRAFLYADGVEYDLNSLIAPWPQTTVSLFVAATIDDNGVILALGNKDNCSFNDPCPVPSVFELTPVAPLGATR